MPDPVLIDTSAWIEALRPEGSTSVRERVDEALADGSAATAEPIIAELLVGARSSGEFDRLDESLRAIRLIPVKEAWARCARLGFDARRKGMTIPTVDLLVACVAMSGDHLLLHADRHFESIATISPLRQLNARIG